MRTIWVFLAILATAWPALAQRQTNADPDTSVRTYPPGITEYKPVIITPGATHVRVQIDRSNWPPGALVGIELYLSKNRGGSYSATPFCAATAVGGDAGTVPITAIECPLVSLDPRGSPKETVTSEWRVKAEVTIVGRSIDARVREVTTR